MYIAFYSSEKTTEVREVRLIKKFNVSQNKIILYVSQNLTDSLSVNEYLNVNENDYTL